MRILLIDNYDSFVYNVYHMLEAFNQEVIVKRNDKFKIEEVSDYDSIVISPGPGDPRDKSMVGNCIDVVNKYYESKPMLGICLGHQIIGYCFGSKIRGAKKIMHGKSSKIEIFESAIFEGLPKRFNAARYHSLVVDDLAKELRAIAISLDDKEIMGLEHIKYPIFGLQFHPESILTKHGKKIIGNFLKVSRK